MSRFLPCWYTNKNIKLVYLNGNNAAEGENNIKYANSYPMNWTVKNWFARDIFDLNRYDRKWIEIVIGLGALWDWIDIACTEVSFYSPEFELNTRFASSNLTLK